MLDNECCIYGSLYFDKGGIIKGLASSCLFCVWMGRILFFFLASVKSWEYAFEWSLCFEYAPSNRVSFRGWKFYIQSGETFPLHSLVEGIHLRRPFSLKPITSKTEEVKKKRWKKPGRGRQLIRVLFSVNNEFSTFRKVRNIPTI